MTLYRDEPVPAMKRLTRSLMLAGVLCCGAGLVTPLGAQSAMPGAPALATLSSADSPPPAYDAFLDAARLAEARIEYAQAHSWKRRLPSFNLYASLATRGVAFPAITAEGFDPLYAALQRWPGDTWGLTVTWRLDQLLDRRARARTAASLATAQARLQATRARLDAERDEKTRQAQADSLYAAFRLKALADNLRRAREEHAILLDLLHLVRLRFDDGEAEYEAVQRARLAVLAKEGEIARLYSEGGTLRMARGLRVAGQ